MSLHQEQKQFIPFVMTAAILAGAICIYNYFNSRDTKEMEKTNHKKILHDSSEAMISASNFNAIVAKTGAVQSIQNLFQDFYTAATVLKMAKHAKIFNSKHLEKLQMPSDLDEFYEELDQGTHLHICLDLLCVFWMLCDNYSGMNDFCISS